MFTLRLAVRMLVMPQASAHRSGVQRLFSGASPGPRLSSDVVELRFSGLLAGDTSETLWRSLIYALLEGATQALGIRRDDIDGTLYRYGGNHLPALVLFDNVPGGAGHVQRVMEQLPAVFSVAYDRVKTECCGPETSCYECLRNYRNQPYHEYLQRGVVRDFLHKVLTSVEQS
jgi:hypothetical protein